MTRDAKRTAVILAASIVVLAHQVAAGEQDVIDRCKQTSSKDDRIACLEAALLMGEPVTAPVANPEPAPETAPLPAAMPVATDEEAEVGAEQVVARTQTQDERVAALKQVTGLDVAEYRLLAHDRLQVTLENGQVWRQIRGDTQRVNATLKRNQTVDISESSLGGYKLRLNEMQRTIRVQRVR